MSSLDCRQYREIVLEDRAYLPDLPTSFPEDDPFRHTVEVEKDIPDIEFDDKFPYLDDSPKYRWNNFILYAGLFAFAFLVNKVRYGLKINNRSIVRRYRKEFRDGAITVCNHVYRWDMVSVLQAIRWRRSWVPIYSEHMMGKDKWFMRYVGGIPVPTSIKGFRGFNAAFDELHRRRQWIHVFPESCNWHYYVPIRPFQKGAFSMSYKYNMPILPCVISYRPRTGIYKLFDKPEVPLITLSVCEPIFPDTSARRQDEVNRLRDEAHSRMCRAAGIIHNPWPSAID